MKQYQQFEKKVIKTNYLGQLSLIVVMLAISVMFTISVFS